MRGSIQPGTNGAKRPALGVVGAGWVGLVTAACFAELGHDVLVHDVDAARLAELERGEPGIHEPGLAELLAAQRERLHYTRDARAVFAGDVVFVCVGTPPLPGGDADLRAVWEVVGALPEDSRTTLVMRSTVPVGTGARVREELDARGLESVAYVSNPEFFAEGNALHEFRTPARIVVGGFDDPECDAVASLYEPLRAPIVSTDVASAEMIKLASNAFLATKISFVNEIANVCEQSGADVAAVVGGMALDERIGSEFLRPGLGFGGSCFPKDVAALKQLAGNGGYHFQLLNAVIEVNELQKRRVIAKLERRLGRLEGRVVALLGLAFKPGTNDLRNAPSLVLAARLEAEGAVVRAWDPAVTDASALGLDVSDDLLATLRGADAAVIVTEWDELRELPLRRLRTLMRTPFVVDGRNMLDPEAVRAAGLAYDSIGRSAFGARRGRRQPAETGASATDASAKSTARRSSGAASREMNPETPTASPRVRIGRSPLRATTTTDASQPS